MNKQYLVYSLLMGSLTLSSLLFSMHNAPKFIYYGSKILATSALPLAGMSITHKGAKDAEEEVADLPDVKSKSPIVCEWAKDILEKAGVPQGDILLKHGKCWASFSRKNKKCIKFPSVAILSLESALQQKSNGNPLKTMTFFEKIKQDFFGLSDDGSLEKEKNYNLCIDTSSMVFKHELGHIIANDSENSQRMKLAITIGIETVCFGANYTFKKFCKISPPKTIMKSLARSGLAFGGIIPKVWCLPLIYRPYSRYREAEADRFACENAATKKELESFYIYWKDCERGFLKQTCHSKKITCKEITEEVLRLEHDKFDPDHPYPTDRADMVQKYINEWDAKHPEDKH